MGERLWKSVEVDLLDSRVLLWEDGDVFELLFVVGTCPFEEDRDILLEGL